MQDYEAAGGFDARIAKLIKEDSRVVELTGYLP